MSLFGMKRGLFPQSTLSGVGINNNRIDDLDIAIMRHTSDQPTSHNTLFEVNFDFTEFVTNPAMRAGSNSRITIQKDGIYIMTAVITWDSNLTGDRTAWIFKNESGGGGGAIAFAQVYANTETTDKKTSFIISGVKKLSAGDDVSVHSKQRSGGILDIDTGVRFSVYQLKEGFY